MVQQEISEDFFEYASQIEPELQCEVAKGWSSTNGVARQMITTSIYAQTLSVIKA